MNGVSVLVMGILLLALAVPIPFVLILRRLTPTFRQKYATHIQKKGSEAATPNQTTCELIEGLAWVVVFVVATPVFFAFFVALLIAPVGIFAGPGFYIPFASGPLIGVACSAITVSAMSLLNGRCPSTTVLTLSAGVVYALAIVAALIYWSWPISEFTFSLVGKTWLISGVATLSVAIGVAGAVRLGAAKIERWQAALLLATACSPPFGLASLVALFFLTDFS